jgi:UDP-N-acetylenolpyruvoylglucosamine reductase
LIAAHSFNHIFRVDTADDRRYAARVGAPQRIHHGAAEERGMPLVDRPQGTLIVQAGLTGTRVGGAEISQKHANFIIAHPGCLADDVKRMIAIIKEKVKVKKMVEGIEKEVEEMMEKKRDEVLALIRT